jgi:CBS domain-containing protein
MLTAEQIMTRNIVTCSPDTSIREAIELLLSRGYSGLPVVDEDGKLIGVITEFALLAIAYDEAVEDQKVEQHMTRDVITVEAAEPISRVADLCIVHRVRRVPVVDRGRVVGLISRRDVLRALHAEQTLLCAV